MRILFIYTNVAKTLQIPMGIAYISSYLKSKDIETFLWDNTFDTLNDLKKMILNINFDYVCIGSLSPDYYYAKKLAYYIKELKNIPIIIGGHHSTYLPHEVIHEKCFDVVVIGEAEYSIYEYIKTKNNKTNGMWIKDGDTIHINDVGEIPNVNKLPWPDHDMFKKHFSKKLTWTKNNCENNGVFITARGCPFKCTYCSCDALHKLYKGQVVTRFRDINDIINEIKTISQKYNFKSIWFTDETLTINKKRIIELCKIYKEEIKIPFSAETRVDTVDEDVLLSLKEAGCDVLRMGIESGVDKIRNGLYKRNMTREKILNVFKLAKKLGLKTSSFNICGAPTETREDIIETIKLNKECEVDNGKMTIFSVFPGSYMWQYCKDNNYFIRDKYPVNYYIDSNIMHETLSNEDLLELRKNFVNMLGGFNGSENKKVI